MISRWYASGHSLATRALSRVPEPWRTGLCLLGITAIAFAVRLVLLGDKALWWDEAWSMHLSQKGPLQIIRESALTQHPPLHYLYLHYWIKLVGDGEFAARLSSVLFGVATVPVVWLLGARAGGRGTGPGAAAFVALAPLHIRWSQEIRMYSAATFFAAASLVLCSELLRRPKAALWIGTVVSTSAMLYSFYGTLLFVGIENLFVVYALVRRALDRRRLWAWIGAQTVVAASLLPWLSLYLPNTQERASSPAPPPLQFLKLVTTALPAGQSTNLDRYLWLAAGFTAVVILGLIALARKRVATGGAGLLSAMALVVGPALLYGLSLPKSGVYSPRIEDRYLVIFVPVYAVALAAGLAAIAKRGRLLAGVAGALALAAIVVQMSAYYDTRQYTYDLRALGRMLGAYYKAGDTVVLNPDKDWPVYAYYLGAEIPMRMIPCGQTMTPEQAAVVRDAVSESPTVWLIETREVALTDPSRSLAGALANEYGTLSEVEFGEARLAVLSRLDASEVFDAGPVAGRGYADLHGLRVYESGLGPARARAGSSVYAWELWAREPDAEVPLARLVLRDRRGSAVLESPQARLSPAEGAVDVSSSLSIQRLGIPRFAPPGEYRATLELFVQGERRVLELGKVSVVRTGDAGTAQTDLVAVGAQWEGGIRLEGYQLAEPAASPGEDLVLTLAWSCSGPLEENLTVFVHVLSEQGILVAQHDGIPMEGAYPTTSWAPGETVYDRHRVHLPADLPAGTYRIVAGLYDPISGRRTRMLQGIQDPTSADNVRVAAVTVASR